MCSWLVVGCRSTAEAVEREVGNCKEDHKVGSVRVLVLVKTVCVAFL